MATHTIEAQATAPANPSGNRLTIYGLTTDTVKTLRTRDSAGTIRILANIPPVTDVEDLGSSTLKWRDGFFSRNVTIGGTLSLPAASLNPAAVDATRVSWTGGLSSTLTSTYADIASGVTERVDTAGIHVGGVVTATAATAGTYLAIASATAQVIAVDEPVYMRIARSGADVGGTERYVSVGVSGYYHQTTTAIVTLTAAQTLTVQAKNAGDAFNRLISVSLVLVRIA